MYLKPLYLSTALLALLSIVSGPLCAKTYPKHWGEPAAIQTRDRRPLPSGFDMGSGTLAMWIQIQLDQDAAAKSPDGAGIMAITGVLMEWHKVILKKWI